MTMTAVRSDADHVPCVLIANSGGGGIAETLDANYFKGQGERQNKEREYVVIGNDSRSSDTED